MTTKEIHDFDIKLTAEIILKGQGIDPARASDRLLGFAEEVLEEAQSLLEPAAIYSLVKVESMEGRRVNFEGGFFEGRLVEKAVKGAEHLYIGVCTIGHKLEKRVDEMMSENPVQAVTLDGAGIAAVGMASQAVEDLISAETCKLDLSLGMKAEPGQEGWPIEQQRQVFSLLPVDKIGVRLTDSCLMLPRKSLSFVIPRGKELDNSILPCDICSKRERCEWRKEKSQADGVRIEKSGHGI